MTTEVKEEELQAILTGGYGLGNLLTHLTRTRDISDPSDTRQCVSARFLS